jgi:hypothetical protein
MFFRRFFPTLFYTLIQREISELGLPPQPAVYASFNKGAETLPLGGTSSCSNKLHFQFFSAIHAGCPDDFRALTILFDQNKDSNRRARRAKSTGPDETTIGTIEKGQRFGT